jgi:hypothetical protein
LYGTSLNELITHPISLGHIPVAQIKDKKAEVLLSTLAGIDFEDLGFFRGRILNDITGPQIQVYSPGMHTNGIEELVLIRGRVRDHHGILEFRAMVSNWKVL